MGAGIRLDLSYYRMAFGDIIVRSVAHVQSEHVRSGFIQFTDYVIVIRRWAKRGYDFDFALTSQVVLSGGPDRCPDAAKTVQDNTCYR